MKRRAFPITLAIASGLKTFTVGAAAASANPLSPYRWKNRLILIYLPAAKRSQIRKLATVLKSQKAGLADRHLVILDLSPQSTRLKSVLRPNAAEIASIKKQLRISGERAQFVLIGKDGGEKKRQFDSIDLKPIFALIDTMPMRRAEMRRSQ